MKVSVNWLKLMNENYGCSDSSILSDVDKLVEKIGAQLGAVEEVIDLGERYKDIVVVKIVVSEKHPNADKLSLCFVDDGGVVKNVARNDKGLVQIVCGAPNVRAGMLAAWIPPNATVPSTYDKDPFVLEARDLRGEMSNGMLASPKELALGDSHAGILELDSGKAGDGFAKALQLDDHIIDIENKMFTHRPDLFGIVGIGREIAGIYGKPFKSPAWYKEDAKIEIDGRKNVLNLSVKNELPELVPRFCAVAIKDVKVGPSPAWLQSFLVRCGIRPINNVVDITNWFMLVSSQPLHAYDYDKLGSATLGVRLSKKGEKLKLLNGKEITLNDDAIVITDGTKPIGMGGVMGGHTTEVDQNTKNIILECASFDMNTVRRTSMTYGLFTDAATRFTKNQSPRQNMAVLAKAAADLLQLVGGRIASTAIDDYPAQAKMSAPRVIETSADFISRRLGENLSTADIKKLLQNVEFTMKDDNDKLKITVPFWRTDIEIPEDIVEEIGRLYGYDKLPQNLPSRTLQPAKVDSALAFKSALREILTRAGANEVLTYNFVHGNLLDDVGQDKELAYQLSNALSPDLQYYRISLTPSLLAKIHPNIKAGFSDFAIYEIGKSHNRKHKEPDEPDLPQEFNCLALVFANSGKSPAGGAAYFNVRKILDFMARELGIEFTYEPLAKESGEGFFVTAPFEPSRSAKVIDKASGQPIGFVGEYKSSVIQKLKLPKLTAGFDISLEMLQAAAKASRDYKPLNRFPSLEQDFTLRASAGIPYAKLYEFMDKQLQSAAKEHGYSYELLPLDIFARESDKMNKQTSWRITLSHPQRTLTTAETNKLLDKIASEAQKELKAERI